MKTTHTSLKKKTNYENIFCLNNLFLLLQIGNVHPGDFLLFHMLILISNYYYCERRDKKAPQMER